MLDSRRHVSTFEKRILLLLTVSRGKNPLLDKREDLPVVDGQILEGYFTYFKDGKL